MKSERWWLALAYSVATLVAPGLHDHDGGGNDAPESRGDCDEQRPHVADHDLTDHGDGPAPCPSCQLRAQHPLAEAKARILPAPLVATKDDRTRPSPVAGSPLRARCRAPPRV